MGANSAIEWTHHTFNPWVGCTKVSAACDHCYAESWAKRTGHAELWQGERRRTSEANWKQPIKWNRLAQQAGERHRVFCASLADVWDNQVPAEWRRDLFDLIRETPHLDWLLLTKRPQNIAKMLWHALGRITTDDLWPWPNVWLGMTAENNEELRRRWHYLRDVPAVVHFLSMEPLLEYVRLSAIRPDWVIVGGESGGHARAMDEAWARDLRDECADAGISFFMKQMARKAPIPADLLVREFPR